MFGISAFAETSFSTLGKIGGIVLASAQVDANAIVTANANAIKPFSAAITADATVTSNATRIRLNNGSINGTANVSAVYLRIRFV